MVNSLGKISTVDRAVTRPSRYLPIALIAVAMAESAQAPLVGNRTPGPPVNAPLASANEKAKSPPPPRGVKDPESYKPLAFEDKNSRADPKKELKRDRIPDTPLVIDNPTINPADPFTLATDLNSPSEPADGITTSGLVGDGYTDPLSSESQVFPADNPFIGATNGPIAAVGKTVTSPGAPVPEPGSSLVLLACTALRRRRSAVPMRSGAKSTPCGPASELALTEWLSKIVATDE